MEGKLETRQYLEECKRFWNPVTFGDSLTTFPILGLVEESVELLQAAIDSDRVVGGNKTLSDRVLSEAGDCLWNIAMICDSLGLRITILAMSKTNTIATGVSESQVEIATRILMKAGQLAGAWRKIHRDDGGDLRGGRVVDIETAIRLIMFDLSLLAGIHMVSLETVMATNIAKMVERHGISVMVAWKK